MDIQTFLINTIGDWDKSTIQIADGLQFSQYQTLRRIEFYANSKYLQGQDNRDARGRIKPFYNVGNYRVNIATRATDIDTKDIQITSDSPKFYPLAFILQKEVYNWMKESEFAATLNEMCHTRAKYGGVLIKKCIEEEEDGEEELEIEVVDWRNVITDPVDIEDTVIEKHFMTAEDFSEKMDSWEHVKECMDLATASPDGKIEVYEIHATLPESYAPEVGDKYTYKPQCFYVLKESALSNNVNILYHEFEEGEIYKYLPWERIPGRGLGRGVIEDGFESQMWTNDAIIREKEAMEIGSKVVFKSTDPNVQNNILSEVENGQVLKISAGTDFSQANMITNAIPEFQNLVEKWNTQYERISSTPGVIAGESQPGNQPFRTTAIINQEANSMFDYRREEMGIFITEVMNDWVLPFLIKKLNKAHILRAEFSIEELKAIDDSFANYTANEEAMNKILSGTPVYAEDYEVMVAGFKEMLGKTGAHRFLDVPKNFFKGFEGKVTVNTTGEQRNKAVILETLNNLLITVAKAPQILQDPKLGMIFAKILDISGSGISPISFGLGEQINSPANAPQGSLSSPTMPGEPMPTVGDNQPQMAQ